MKKLFVLFLLVSLVPFTVGCSLWGGDDEAVTYPLVATASVVVPAAGIASLRAVAAPVAGTAWQNYTVSVNGVTLDADTWETVTGSTDVKLTFKAIVSSADYNKAMKATGLVPVIISNGTTAGTTSYVNVPAGATGAFAITVTATGAVSAVEIGTTTVPAEDIAAGTFTITSVMIGDKTLGTTSASPASATSLFPTFIVTLPGTMTVTNGALPTDANLSITTKNAAGVTVAITAADFTVAQGDAANKITVTVKDQVEPKRLNDGTVYNVTINTLRNADKLLAAPATYYFVVDLP